MSDGLQELRERHAQSETRLENLECALREVKGELARLAQLIRGNGDTGLVAQVQMQEERIQVLQRQWKWLVGMLAALFVAVAQSVFLR